MIDGITFTDLYIFKRIDTTAKTRLDCVASTKSYTRFEEKRARQCKRANVRTGAIIAGGLIARYQNKPKYLKAQRQRQGDSSIAMGNEHISSIFEPDPKAGAGWGDVKNTADALLVIYHDFELINGAAPKGAVIELFVARGQSRNAENILFGFIDGLYDEELEALRKRATPDPTATGEEV